MSNRYYLYDCTNQLESPIHAHPKVNDRLFRPPLHIARQQKVSLVIFSYKYIFIDYHNILLEKY